MKKFLLLLLVTLTLAACSTPTPAAGENPVVTITMDDGGTIKLELYPDKAPNTVANFVALIQEGFYDGLTFHRTSAEFMIQGGDPNGSGTGGPGYAIAGEFAANGFPRNDLSHERGVLSMARSNDYDSAGSQFFIMTVDMTGLDGQYAAFGRVVEGMDVADGIAAGPNTGVAGNYMALEPRTMQSVTVDTFGQAYTAEKK